jgi:hypothetical protein
LVAIGAIVLVPVLAAFFPRWAARLALPLLTITSMGVLLTVPDTERVSLIMALVLIGSVVCLAMTITPSHAVVAATAFVIIGGAIMDSADRDAAIARAIGCFGVLLAAPIAGWLNELRKSGDRERRPAETTLVAVHCLVVAWSSRGLIRETSLSYVVVAVGGALVAAVMILFATARLVTVDR